MRRGEPCCTTWPAMPASSGMRSSPPATPSAGRPTSVRFGLSQRKMLARSAFSNRVAAWAICSKSGTISCVWFHWAARRRMVSSCSLRRCCASLFRTLASAAANAAASESRVGSESLVGFAMWAINTSVAASRGVNGAAIHPPSLAASSRSRASASRSAGSGRRTPASASITQRPSRDSAKATKSAPTADKIAGIDADKRGATSFWRYEFQSSSMITDATVAGFPAMAHPLRRRSNAK